MTAEANAGLHEVLISRLFHPSTIVLSGVLLASLIFFRPVLMAGILIAAGAVSIIYKRWVSIGIDLELCSLCAVAVGASYGATAGAFSGGLSMLLALALNGHAMENPFFAAIKTGTIAGLGILAGAFVQGNIVPIATAYTFIADLAFVLVAFQTGGNAGKLLVFLVTHALIVFYQLRLLLPVANAIL